jgi:hypothetical protein
MDALLLSHMVARASVESKDGGFSSTLMTFLSLLPGPGHQAVPPFCGQQSSPIAANTVSDFFARFANNNFVVQSHLNTFAHGVFPLASRLFNHSCVPNAAVKYDISRSRAVDMHVIALSDIAIGDQVRTTTSLSVDHLQSADMHTISRSCITPDSTADIRVDLWLQM